MVNEDADGEGDGDDTASDLDNPWQSAPLAQPSEERRRTGTCVEPKRAFCTCATTGTATRAARLDIHEDLVISSYLSVP